MDIEVARLQHRVAELEAALARLSSKTDRTDLRRRRALAPQVCAGILILCIGILLGGGTGSSAAPPLVPTKVVQPFQVVDGTGRVLFEVAMGSGGMGLVTVKDPNGNSTVTLTGGSSEFGNIRVVNGSIRVVTANGSNRVLLGLSNELDGQIQVLGKANTASALDGKGELQLLNAQRKRVASLGVSSAGTGDLHLHDDSGNERVTIGSPPAGSGRPHVAVLSSDGSLKAGIGINSENGGGVMVLKGGNLKTSLWLTGQGLLQAVNAQDKRVVSLGISGTGAGDFHLYNTSGINVAGISAEQGPGVLQLRNAGGQERVTAGTLSNGKGDVCASGEKSANCLSRIDPRY